MKEALNQYLKLYAITDRAWLNGSSLASAVEQAILGGATIIQFREKLLTGEQLKQEAKAVRDICREYGIPFIVNDDVYLALELDADGVHVGASDMGIREARELLGENKIIGATAKTVQQAIAAEAAGADYLGSGAIFGTTTKADAKPMTMQLLTEICGSVSLPVVAIGGIDETNIAKLRKVPVCGCAVVSGIFAQKNIRAAAEQLRVSFLGKSVIQCMTNYVTANEVANALLAFGASPIMAHHIKEVEEVQRSASGLLLNLGATDDYDAMLLAYRAALQSGHPVVIDPVGVGGIEYRRNFLKKLLTIGSPTCIRGNMGEIRAILKDESTMRGLDYAGDNAFKEDELAVRTLSEKLSCIIVATGEQDMIADPEAFYKVDTGSPRQKMVTGSGCMLSAILCAKLSLNPMRPSRYLAGICKCVGDAAVEAAGCEGGTMNFLHAWMDRFTS